MNEKKIVIVGYDAISPLGLEINQQWERALCGDSGIGKLTRFPVNDDFPVQIAGQVPEIAGYSYPFLRARELASWTSPIFQYALLTVQRALTMSRIEITADIAPRVAITFSSAIGGVDALLKADRRMIAESKLPNPFMNPNSCINMVGGKISILTGATGPITSTITACSTGVSSIIVGAMFLALGRADVAICGAVDFPLVEPIIAGFATMNAAYVYKENEPHVPEKASRPFSIDRRGFVVSEGSGAIIITTEEFAKAHGLNYQIEIAGWHMTSDAFHFVSPNFDTVKQCMSESIRQANITPQQINAINAHATSTKVGDRIEYDTLKAIFGNHIPPVTANKSLIGHAMGASSAIESVFTIQGMITDQLPPTLNYHPDKDMELDCVAEGRRSIVQEYVLKNAFGFGGCNSCIVFRRIR
ncbi:MAG: beta-ketoacyl-[acyl-carrier-protein] synthase family protein [Desulfobacterales bacterium]|nr:beta-ketoacyl-[acyl-carrier-protein] synthase family protein [Desulfobacterales bacterium]